MMISNCIMMEHFGVDSGLSGEKTHEISKVCIGNILDNNIVTTIGAMLIRGRPNISIIKLKFIINFFYNQEPFIINSIYYHIFIIILNIKLKKIQQVNFSLHKLSFKKIILRLISKQKQHNQAIVLSSSNFLISREVSSINKIKTLTIIN